MTSKDLHELNDLGVGRPASKRLSSRSSTIRLNWSFIGKAAITHAGDHTRLSVGVKFLRASRQHRLFSFITQNWHGKPLVSYQTIVQLIACRPRVPA